MYIGFKLRNPCRVGWVLSVVPTWLFVQSVRDEWFLATHQIVWLPCVYRPFHVFLKYLAYLKIAFLIFSEADLKL